MNTNSTRSSAYGNAQDYDGISTKHFPARVQFILQLLQKLDHGILIMEFPDGQSATYGNVADERARPVTMMLKNWDVFNAALKSGDIGFAETFIDGHWSTDDLPGLIELFIRNRQVIESVIYGTWWGNFLYRVKHLFNRNSKTGSRKNIHAHYDIGNDFYQLWLDPSMTYSSALFSDDHVENLQQGQDAKYRRILSQLRLPANSRILEIGCGWGAFAEIAVREANAHVTGLTLSTEQLHFANQRLQDAGVVNRVELLLQDYRDVEGKFDGIASIEMFEAVGEKYWPSYFSCIASNLKTGGRACIQTIVIDDTLFERYRRGTDFIQQYIFPGGMLPSPSAFRAQAESHGLKVVDTLSFGLDYARTLVEWRRAFKEQLPKVRAQGFDDRFLRTWDFYLAYCEAGFIAGSINVAQFTLQKK
ncbi:cyclopropane-fatty-acyl-phospholipid synthase family protein [Glaciimonas sp. CA11.2]|uniref:cyclopropane-fatty-acyl-phospholipid synthase family protein n=1 Tax=unclassified Glaciimonas TaxID=2644401 RepID=UPI002AB4FC02|nr:MULTISPECIES: cyclopropane-fatty-acyl-phospholipid synthase family protein [unclassified Glaciimonas]MDY7546428.1 cyclopropane-fatty-acyl-phospholipid synthase family protein [Glaciimonas sp. CA11.2]MEB0014098.1 cyclopropane-fatty-acyl-phospholipid synthase family protein [Glaciimonas sp. Cout2]MEB0083430.1 cyclopropane-fatty-acyl-phospholipid synthase family protein [Glaciimonas sp. Gout2]MEB0162553.1 cyclopropane-fatty-acyl-phospholipid synthase family protein [Glaciimonas sp. CA11.2]